MELFKWKLSVVPSVPLQAALLLGSVCLILSTTTFSVSPSSGRDVSFRPTLNATSLSTDFSNKQSSGDWPSVQGANVSTNKSASDTLPVIQGEHVSTTQLPVNEAGIYALPVIQGVNASTTQLPINEAARDGLPAIQRQNASTTQLPVNEAVRDALPAIQRQNVSTTQLPVNEAVRDALPAIQRQNASTTQLPVNEAVRDALPAIQRQNASTTQLPVNEAVRNVLPAIQREKASTTQLPVTEAASDAPPLIQGKNASTTQLPVASNPTSAELPSIHGALVTNNVTANLSNRSATKPTKPTSAQFPLLHGAADHETHKAEEKFLMPILSFQVGSGNQLMEYMSAAVVAHALNRTLCLTPFFSGPTKHSGLSSASRRGLAWEDRYDAETLSRFVRVSSLDNCLKQCHKRLDASWLLKPSREPLVRNWDYVPPNNEAWNLDWSFVRWQSSSDITQALNNVNDRCVGLGGLFPGLRWRGAFLSVSAFLQPSKHIADVTNALQERAIGRKTPYLAVHWRFEESECGRHNIGLCFVRCSDGAVIDSGLHSSAREWLELSKDQCKDKGHFRGVAVDKDDVIDALYDRATRRELKTIYLATDGWMPIRGPEGAALVKEVVERLRRRGLAVVGLWKIEGLPNFSDGKYYDPKSTLGERNQVSSQEISLVEQELCTRAAVFLGSGQSTWSLAVFRLRLAHRRAEEIVQSQLRKIPAANKLSSNKHMMDEAVIEGLLQDNHAAGLQCRYSRYYARAKVNATVETYADEAPDGWLDLEACESRIGRGGKCKVAKCF